MYECCAETQSQDIGDLLDELIHMSHHPPSAGESERLLGSVSPSPKPTDGGRVGVGGEASSGLNPKA